MRKEWSEEETELLVKKYNSVRITIEKIKESKRRNKA